MSKASKQRRSKKRREEKKARKRANYLRFGPKEGGVSKSKKRQTVGEGKPKPPKGTPPPKTSAKGRRRRRKNGLKWCRKTR